MTETSPDYAAKFGLESEHVPELIRLACDAALYDSGPDSTESWAPVHAWRALGQMRAAASIRPLLAFLKAAGNDDDWAHIELPLVLGLIGTAAIAAVAAFIRDQSNSTFPAATAILGLKEIARRHPACHGECIDILVRLLGQRGDTDPTLKGFAVSALIDLKAVEAIDVIRGAFRRESVDISIAGGEEDVEIELRLGERRATPAPRYQLLPASRPGRPDESRNTDVSPRAVKAWTQRSMPVRQRKEIQWEQREPFTKRGCGFPRIRGTRRGGDGLPADMFGGDSVLVHAGESRDVHHGEAGFRDVSLDLRLVARSPVGCDQLSRHQRVVPCLTPPVRRFGINGGHTA